jgi:hypothetical protein
MPEVTYRFLRQTSRDCSFARAKVRSEPSADWSVSLGDLPGRIPDLLVGPIRTGIARAIAAHIRSGGESFAVLALELEFTAMDTHPQTVEIAFAVATWTAFGHPEESVAFERDSSDRWQVSFPG